MRGNKVYFIFLIAVVGLYVIFEIAKDKPEDWTTTFHYQNKIPFGTELLHQMMPSLFEGQPVESVFRTVYELTELDSIDENILIVSEGFACDKNDFEAMLNYASDNHQIMIAAYQFSGALQDSLKFSTDENIRLASLTPPNIEKSLGESRLENIEFKTKEGGNLQVPSLVAASYFVDVSEDKFDILAVNSDGNPVIIKYSIGSGAIYLTSMPLAFTNYMALNDEARPLTETLLSLLPAATPIVHNEYYQLGRLENTTPLRVLLSNPALKSATYLTLVTFLVLIIFDSKRKQRVIPIVKTLQNTSLEFAHTLGQLYYRQSDHQKLAKKRMKYWVEHINKKYNLRPGNWDKEFRMELVKKSGATEQVCKTLIEHFKKVEAGGSVPSEELVSIEKTLNEFYGIN